MSRVKCEETTSISTVNVLKYYYSSKVTSDIVSISKSTYFVSISSKYGIV